MRLRTFLLCIALQACMLLPNSWTVFASEVSVTLSGSPGSMVRQNQVAKELGYPFMETPGDIERLVETGELVPVEGNKDLQVLEDVQYPYARPEVRLFIERLAAQYHEGTGERLVVTSLSRPTSGQPANSHALSVHPTGMAMDLRISKKAHSQRWLESVLLSLERKGLLDVTRERYPPHYHVALFPEAYRTYLGQMIGAEAVAEGLKVERKVKEPIATLVELTAKATATQAPPPVVAATDTAEEESWLRPVVVLPFFLLGGVLGYRLGHLRVKRSPLAEIVEDEV